MKKLLTLICMLACIFGLTACGSEGDWLSEEDLAIPPEELTYEQWKVKSAMQIAKVAVVPMLSEYMSAEAVDALDDFTMEEIEYLVKNESGLTVDGYAFYTAAGSFESAADSVGGIRTVGEVSAKTDGDQIIVDVKIGGAKKDAVAEVIFSNDSFFVMESAALNPVSTMGELMTGAALNTLIGMGTVFVVLILISCIISCFKVISVLQNKAAERKTRKSAVQESAGVDNAVAQIVDQEQVSGDDLELAAVIAAAIAAFEGSASTDGFVVRSIRRQRNI